MSHFRTALANLATTKLRTALAMLGIVVGTASVVAMVSSGQLATQQALAQFKALGTDMMAISLYSESSGDASDKRAFDLKAALSLQSATPAIRVFAPYVMLYAPLSYQGNVIDGAIIGATASLQPALKIKMKLGRFISDLDNYNTYCVIGNSLYGKLRSFSKNPIGKQIKVGNTIFTIAGVADQWPENSFFNQDINNAIIIPIKAANLLTKYTSIDNVILRLDPQADTNKVQNDISDRIKAAASEKKLFFHSAKELIKRMEAQHQIFTWLLGFIGSISLLVGGIGVMNIMLVSVLERRREIGIRLAVGANKKDIQWMFLSEAVMLTITGGLCGIATGIICSFIIAQFAHWHFVIFLWPPIIGFTVSVLVGLFFGYYPAKKAANLDPIETLRTE